MTVDIKLSFNEHINDKLNEANKDVGILWKVQTILPHATLLSIYKFSIRPLLDYVDVMYDQPSNAFFSKRN